ncbi:MAG: hypothetical protein H0V13_04120 [Nocardioidaceae bacterium]|nr:hypothetical protein [Nocardioidaceae bacterium]
MAEPTRSLSSGPGRVLVAVYAVLALSATGRSVVQLVTKGDEAPVAYTLSAVAAVVYIVATVGLARSTPGSRRVAWVAISAELVGVLLVGLLSVVDVTLFDDASVWSDFGQGYGYVPLVLPVLGIAWLLRTRT